MTSPSTEVPTISAPTPAAGTVAATPPRGSLDGRMMRGMMWVGGARWTSQAISLVTTVIVARLLRPSDYGLVGMAGLFFGVVNILAESAIGITVVRHRSLSQEALQQFVGGSLLVGTVCTVLTMLAAYPLRWFFHAPALLAVVLVGSMSFIVASARSVPVALLGREMQFRRLAQIDFWQAIVQAIATLVLAAFGAGYWSLVLGPNIGNLLATVLAIWSSPVRPSRPRLAELGHTIVYTRQVLSSRLAWYVYSNADFLVAGRRLGSQALGAYSYAWSLASLPVDRITAVFSGVTSSVFSVVQDDQFAVQRYLRILTEGISLIAFPIAVGIALVANDFVPIILGEQWRSMIVPLQLLAAYAPVRALTPLLSQVLLMRGQSRTEMRIAVSAALAFPIVFFVGSRWGTVGIAAGWLVAHPVLAVSAVSRVLKNLKMSALEYLGALWPAFAATAGMAALVLLVQWRGTPGTARLAASVAVGAVTYAAILFLGFRHRLKAMTRVLAEMRSRRSAS